MDKRAEYKKNYYLKHREKYLIKSRMRYLYREYTILSEKVYLTQGEKKERMKAWRKVEYAVQSGKLKKKNCYCGEVGEAHHEDYSKPLEVKWLCRKHHAEAHRGAGIV